MTDYTAWMRQVDKHMIAAFGLSSGDLPDALWRDKFDDGLDPLDAIDATVEDEWADVPGMAEVWYG
jgi:hypothetical protein